MNPKRPLAPALSPDGGEGDRSRGLFEVQGFNARIFCRGILTPAPSPGGEGETLARLRRFTDRRLNPALGKVTSEHCGWLDFAQHLAKARR